MSFPTKPSRRALLGLGLTAFTSVLAFTDSRAGKLEKLPFKIAANAAPLALAEFIRQTGMQVLFDFDAVRHFSTREVNGRLDAQEALSMMFEGSGLMFEFINERTIAVRPRPPEAAPALDSPQRT